MRERKWAKSTASLRSKYQEYQGRIVVVCASTALCVELYFTRTFLGKQNETTYESSFKSSLSDFSSFSRL